MKKRVWMKNKALQFYLLTALLIFGTAIYQMLHITGPTLYPDEFGYWANAAQWLGFDWSSTAALQSYYSFGYSIFLLPLLRLFGNPFMRYRAAVLLNVLFVYFHAVLLRKLALQWKRKEGNGKTEEPDLWSCLFAACYPGLLFYMQTTMTESLLSFLFLSAVWLFMKYDATRRIRYAALFITVLVYMHFVHMRTVGVLAAGVLSLGWSILRGGGENPKRPAEKGGGARAAALLSLLILTALLAACGTAVKELLQSGLYKDAGSYLVGLNDYSGRLAGLRPLLTAEGIGNFLVSCIGKLFYLGLASLGTFYFGMWRLWKRCKREPCCLFPFTAVLFTFVLIAASTAGGGRGDAYIYGRYNEFLLPAVLYMGLCEMRENRRVFPAAAAAVTAQGAAGALLVYSMAGENPVWFQGYFVVGISYALQERMADISLYILYPLAACSLATGLLALVTGWFVRRKKALIRYLGLFVGLFIYTAASAGGKYLYDHSLDTGEDMAMLYQLYREMGREDTAVFLNSESDALYVDIIQFCLREHPLQVIREEAAAQREKETRERADYVLTYRNSRYEDILKDTYDTVKSTYHFRLYYNKK